MWKEIALKIFSKERIIGWISAVAFVIGAAAVGMQQDDFKKSVCGAPAIQEKPVEQK
jgi:hypothetical protein